MEHTVEEVLAHPLKTQQHTVYGKEPESLEEVFNMVYVMINYNLKHNTGLFANTADVELVGMRMELGYSDSVSSTHSCTMFEKLYDNNNKAKPGYSGRIWLRYDKQFSSFSTADFLNTATWTGSGGSGWYEPWSTIVDKYYKAPAHIKKHFIKPYCLGYDFRFFLADFPSITNLVEQEQIIAKLKDAKYESKFQKTTLSKKQHNKDLEFIRLCKKTQSRRNLNLDYK